MLLWKSQTLPSLSFWILYCFCFNFKSLKRTNLWKEKLLIHCTTTARIKSKKWYKKNKKRNVQPKNLTWLYDWYKNKIDKTKNSSLEILRLTSLAPGACGGSPQLVLKKTGVDFEKSNWNKHCTVWHRFQKCTRKSV